MRILVTEKLSQNRYKTPEGYLVCLNCILSRTGKQTYSRSEVFGGDDESEVEVDRDASEVFSSEALASFENKPLTIQHPDEDVTVDNYNEYAKGFVRNIRKGTVDGKDVMIGDIVVTDKEAIEKIESGELLDLSCGYDCDIQDEEHPQQRNIRGNHVALCEQGRAGCARIVDSVNDDLKADVLRAIDQFKSGMRVSSVEEFQKVREVALSKHVDAEYNDRTGYVSFIYNSRNDSANNERKFFYKCTVNNQYYVSADPNKIADLNPKLTNVWGLEKIDGNFINMDGGRMNYMNRVKGSPEAVKEYLRKKGQCINLDDSENSEKAKQALEEGIDKLEEHMEDVMQTYKIHWIDTYARSKGYSKDMWSYDFETKANSLKEALQKLADKVVLGGTGTYNALVVSARSDTTSYMYTGKLSDLLRSVNDEICQSGYGEEEYTCVEDEENTEKHTFEIQFWDKTDDLTAVLITAKDRQDAIQQFRRKYGQYTIEKITVKDGCECRDKLIEVPESILRSIESELKSKGVKITGKGRTWFDRIHYQVEFNGPASELVRILKEIDNKLDKMYIPMTYSVGGEGNHSTAGFDLDPQYIKDSVKDSRKTYEVKSKDKKGNIIVKYVKANSIIDAVRDASLASVQEKEKEIAELEKELKEEVKKNGEFSKHAIFLRSTINVYLQQLKRKPKYQW